MIEAVYAEDSKMCSICFITFSFLGPSKHFCSFCFRAVCSKCSMQKAFHSDSKSVKKICDTCYSEMIKGIVINHYKFEQDRLKSEIFNFQKRMEIEKVTCEKEAKSIEELNRSIEDTKNEIKYQELEKNSEISNLKQEIDKIDSDFHDISSRLELLAIKNLELDSKIFNSEDQNREFLTGDIDGLHLKIKNLSSEILELNGNFKLQKKSVLNENFDYKVLRIKEDIRCLKNQKNRLIEKIGEMKAVEGIKETNISMLLTNLSNASTSAEIGLVHGSFEDDEICRTQEEEICELTKKIEKIKRKNVIESKTCECLIQ